MSRGGGKKDAKNNKPKSDTLKKLKIKKLENKNSTSSVVKEDRNKEGESGGGEKGMKFGFNLENQDRVVFSEKIGPKVEYKVGVLKNENSIVD